MTNPKQGDQSGEIANMSPALLKRFADMANILPRGAEDGGERILEQILNAQSVMDTNEIWSDTWDAKKLNGVPLIIEAAEVLSSDYAGGLGVYLGVTATNKVSGEQGRFSTGSISIVAQIVLAYTRNELPFDAKLVQADEPTKNGFYPQHLVVEGIRANVKAK